MLLVAFCCLHWFPSSLPRSDDDDDDDLPAVANKKRPRRRVTYDENTAGAKSPEGRTKNQRKKPNDTRKKENRSFFPNGKQPNNNEALSGTGSNNALVRSLLAQSLKQPLRPRNGGNVATAAMGGYGESGRVGGGKGVLLIVVVVDCGGCGCGC